MGTQLGFADALIARKAGQNRRLEAIDGLVDWPAIERILSSGTLAAQPKAAGRPPYPPLAMLKAMLLAQWYRLSDPGLEEALSDRLSFRRFCGFALDAETPDETTLCRFRNALAARGIGDKLMAELDRQFDARKLLIKDGTMIDATVIEAQAARPKDAKPDPQPSAPDVAPASKPSAEPAAKSGRTASDRDARFTRKGGRSYYGYKAHVGVDRGSGLIRRATLTPANVHDTMPADDLVMGDEAAIYADKAYSSHARRAHLRARGIKDRIMHRANKHQPKLPRWQDKRNGLIAKARAAVERTFGIWKCSYGYRRVRYFTLTANAFELQLKCIAFNLRRAATLTA